MKQHNTHPVTYQTQRTYPTRTDVQNGNTTSTEVQNNIGEVAAYCGRMKISNKCNCGLMRNHSKNECGNNKYSNKMNNRKKRYSHIPASANMKDLAGKWDKMHYNIFGE